jgi:CheY-like chemotaxis protein
MPKMDGWQVAKQIRQLSAPKRPLLIAISGHGMQADLLRSHEAGIDLHLLKPADMVALERLLQRFQTFILRPIVMTSAERRLAKSHRHLWLDSSLQHWSERAMLRKRVATIREIMSIAQTLRARLKPPTNPAGRLSIRSEFCEQAAQLLDENERIRQLVNSFQRWGVQTP